LRKPIDSRRREAAAELVVTNGFVAETSAVIGFSRKIGANIA
jgi:hypothetical protein